jgi:hypothetical protein
VLTLLKVTKDENSGDKLIANFSGKAFVSVIIQLLFLIIVFAVPAEKLVSWKLGSNPSASIR